MSRHTDSQAFRLGWIESGQVARYIAKYISQPSLVPDSEQNLDDLIEAAETTWRASASQAAVVALDDGLLTRKYCRSMDRLP